MASPHKQTCLFSSEISRRLHSKKFSTGTERQGRESDKKFGGPRKPIGPAGVSLTLVKEALDAGTTCGSTWSRSGPAWGSRVRKEEIGEQLTQAEVVQAGGKVVQDPAGGAHGWHSQLLLQTRAEALLRGRHKRFRKTVQDAGVRDRGEARSLRCPQAAPTLPPRFLGINQPPLTSQDCSAQSSQCPFQSHVPQGRRHQTLHVCPVSLLRATRAVLLFPSVFVGVIGYTS